MYISKIEIENFRNFEKLSIDTNPKIAIIGENRAGKTNLLYALRLLLDDTLPNSCRTLERSDFWDGLPNPIVDGCEISISVELSGFESDIELLALLSDYLVRPGTARINYVYTIRDESKKGAGESLSISDYGYYIYGGNDCDKSVRFSDFSSSIKYKFLSALRDVENDLARWSKSPINSLINHSGRFDEKEIHSLLSNIGMKIEEAKQPLLEDKAIEKAQEDFNDSVEETIGLSSVKTKFDISSSSKPEELLKSLRISSCSEDGKYSRGLEFESLGINNVLYYLLYRLSIGDSSVVFAIEEPEAHLHPHLQRLIFNDSKKNLPLLLTTHSPHVISSIDDLRNIVLLKKVGNKTQAVSLKNIELLPEELANIKRYLDVTRSEILFAKGVILVEGVAESFIVSEFARQHLGYPLDYYGISICSVEGTHFTDYVKLLKHLGVPFVVITDGDPQSKTIFPDVDAVILDGIYRGVKIVDQVVNNGYMRSETESNAKDSAFEQVVYDGGKLTTNEKIIKKAVRTLINSFEEDYLEELKEYGFFINKSTIELELLKLYEQEYKDIFKKYLSERKYNNSLAHFLNNKEDKILERIESSDFGKGRFAQLLSSKLDKNRIPLYLKNAVEEIVKQVKSNV